MTNFDSAKFQIFPLYACKDLAPVCAAWSFSEWGCHEDNPRSLQQVIDSYSERASGSDRLPQTWVCVVDGKPAGMASLKTYDHEALRDKSPWLGSLFVHPFFRGKGIAHQLCASVIAEARQRGFEKLYLFTGTAQNLYESLGWRQIGTVPDPRGFHQAGEALMELGLR